jgi:hypothetical protein
MGVGNGGLGVALSTPTMLRFEMTLLCSSHLVMHIWIVLFLLRYTASCVDIISILLFVAYDAGLDVPFFFSDTLQLSIAKHIDVCRTKWVPVLRDET